MSNPHQTAEQILADLQRDDGVVVGQADAVLIKLRSMLHGGLGNLHVVTDFDCTLTR
jgi:hypothetical protein